MNAPLNVLAVMDDRADAIERYRPKAYADGLREARAAVAELIEALARALPTVEHYYHTNPDPDGSLWRDVLACRAAIARCGGAK